MTTSQEVKSLSGVFLQQIRGIFSGIEKLPAAFEELEAREREVGKREQGLAAAADRSTDLAGQIRQKESSLRALTAEADGLAADLAAARRAGTLAGLVKAKETQVVELDAAIAAKQAVLDKLTTDLNALKAKHSL
jgi:chromosome segregation ATPase